MLLLILESLGGTELLFILVMALVFFGPRKLPQISRSLGKSLAEFRRASDDFKRTWEQEVEMENPRSTSQRLSGFSEDEPGLLDEEPVEGKTPEPAIEPLPEQNAVPRERRTIMAEADNSATSETPPVSEVTTSDPPQKRDWL